MLFNSEEDFFDTKKYANKTNNTKFNLFPKRSIECKNIFTEKSTFNEYNETTPVKNNKEDNIQMEMDETDIFIQKLLKEEESLIKLQIKVKLEEEKNQILQKEIERSNNFLLISVVLYNE